MTLAEKEQGYVQQLANAATSKDKILPYLGLAWVYSHFDTQKSLQTARKALILARQVGDDRSYGHCLHSMAEAYCQMDKVQKAIELFSEAASVAYSVADYKHAVQSDTRRSYALLQIGEREAALELALSTWQTTRVHGDPYTKGVHLTWIGALHVANSDNVSALRFLHSGVRILERNSHDDHAAWAHANIANCLLQEGEYAEALQAALHSLRLSRSTGNPVTESYSLSALASALARLGHQEQHAQYKRLAIMCKLRSQRLTANTSNNHDKTQSLATLGDVYRLCGHIEKAYDYLEEALRSARKTPNSMHLLGTLISLGKLNKEAGSLDTAKSLLTEALCLHKDQRSSNFDIEILQELMLVSELMGRPTEALQYCKSMLDIHNSRTHKQIKRDMKTMRERINVNRLRAQRERQSRQGRELQTNVTTLQQKSSKASLVIARNHSVLSGTHQKLKQLIKRAERPEVVQELRILANEIHQYMSNSNQEFDSDKEFNTVNNAYLTCLSQRFPQLTSTDLKVCTLVRMQLSTKDIAGLLQIEPRSVQVYRTRIRRKLDLPRQSSLTTFLNAIP